MKVRTDHGSFKPFTLTIDVETEDEALGLYAMFNKSASWYRDQLGTGGGRLPQVWPPTYSVWETIASTLPGVGF